MKETIFRDNTVQTGFRVKIPKAIIDTLDLKVRDKILIKFDAESGKIVIEEDKKKRR